ncbi:MAG: peptide chain release factor N(5)-glutamine methyltransferase [Alphaproteobacteria bacterium GM7ARS4]|nr:peptide chain release factor N(5)-glutamine methyltransferase [Alphaproteobacteria bacterium GM7ARS4]
MTTNTSHRALDDATEVSVDDGLSMVAAWLKEAHIEQPFREARLLMGLCLDMPMERVFCMGDMPLPSSMWGALEVLAQRRCAGESYARLKGEKEFWSLTFAINAHTLEPRPDSESLVEAALRHAHPETRLVLDIGTGSGCLLAAFLHERAQTYGYGVDISFGACLMARANWHRLGLAHRATALCGHWGHGWGTRQCDVIFCNPPYVTHHAYRRADFARFEPRCALDGGEDGLDAYRSLLPSLVDVLSVRGVLILEIGDGYAPLVASLIRPVGLCVVAYAYDLSGKIRGLVMRNHRKYMLKRKQSHAIVTP